MIYRGGCHCGAVRFEVEAPEDVEASDCNCSVCSLTGFVHLIVPARDFQLLSGADRITTYRFNTGVAKHMFCRVCGIKSFYIPRSNPDGVDVDVRCLDPKPRSVAIEPFDGQNWEAHAGSLAEKSR